MKIYKILLKNLNLLLLKSVKNEKILLIFLCQKHQKSAFSQLDKKHAEEWGEKCQKTLKKS